METELSAPPELLLAALTESMRAQREIIALLRELKLEVAELRDASADELMAIELREPALAEPSLEQVHDTDGRTVQAPDDARDPPEATCDDPALPLLKTLVNADGSPIHIEKTGVGNHFAVLE